MLSPSEVFLFFFFPALATILVATLPTSRQDVMRLHCWAVLSAGLSAEQHTRHILVRLV